MQFDDESGFHTAQGLESEAIARIAEVTRTTDRRRGNLYAQIKLVIPGTASGSGSSFVSQLSSSGTSRC